jgi:activator of HSP90 ATPase
MQNVICQRFNAPLSRQAGISPEREKILPILISSNMKTFKKTFKINAEPSDVYSAITNPYTIELWTGYPAVMSEEPGSEFSLWDGDITGKNIEFVGIFRSEGDFIK